MNRSMNSMEKFVIQGLGGKKTLKGTVRVNGAKNAALKAMAAAVLFDGPVRLKNMPHTEDIHIQAEILRKLGADVSWTKDSGEIDHAMEIDTRGLRSTDIDGELAGKMRASVVLTGPLLGRFGKATFPAPGGCVIGARPIDLFISGYEAMGAMTKEDGVYDISVSPKSKVQSLKGANIIFKKVSVGATETLMMAAVLAEGKTVLENCACEPEIVNVVEWLNACGAKIKGVGTSTIEIEGTGGRLLSSESAAKNPYVAIPDRIEAGSYLVLGALCADELKIDDCRPEHLGALIDLLKLSGVPIKTTDSSIVVSGNTMPDSSFKTFDVTTKEYPGFATDLQPMIAVYMTQVSGRSKLTETIYEGRFKYVDDLKSLGADIDTVSSQEITISGPSRLKALPAGREMKALDIRAGFAVVLAALCAEGETTVTNIGLIDRGYERLEERLQSLGADVVRN
ncbi:MAG: UDP-N-acetylglucosamine 1-carboxyvinyltransferase [Patescibacteria group bacterium]|nr:UDP-N-acetylglucosamine 1-carboxyvinyltransferase [Patescibacteria group bacterium]